MKVVVGFLDVQNRRRARYSGLIHSWEPDYKHIALENRYRLGLLAMCLTFPGRVVAIRGESASVDYGPDGVRNNVNVSLVDAQIGNYVLVQGGFAIRVLSNREAKESLEAWKVIRELQGD